MHSLFNTYLGLKSRLRELSFHSNPSLVGRHMIFVTDAIGECIFVSMDWQRLTGQCVADALGWGWMQRVHLDDRATVVETTKAAAAAAAEFTVRYRLMTPENTPRWVGAGGVPSFGMGDQRFIGYLGSVIELAGGATDTIAAYGNIERFIPPTPHLNTRPSCKLDLVADHLLAAHSLIEEDGGKNAMPALREALFQVGLALAARTLKPDRPLN